MAVSIAVRVVLDTNILVSACWKPGGNEAEVARLATTGSITPCVSAVILAEYRDVLSRRKLSGISGMATELLASLERVAVVVEPSAETGAPVQASVDEDDNRFLECVDAAGAGFLITGNLRHYPEVWGAARIVNARTFLSLRYKQ
ncbi:MAG TPA: putative toxin-antitoxin system toxin component, PIN family [Bryobacteraceae bacterium]|nr:putative toxin-antitoxin system toxin component, PIN family [Bryobacteraceae bacterium]